MDDDFVLPAIVVCILLGVIVFFVWMKSQGRRRVTKTIREAQDALKLSPFVGSNPQLDAVWYAVRGQVSGLTVKIFGGKSRGVTGGASAIDGAVVLVIVTMPSVIPFRFNIQRRTALSTPRFGTSYEEFDKIVEVKTENENEKSALTLLNSEQLRAAIISFIKPTTSAFITSSEVIIKLSSDKQILPFVHDAVNIATLFGNQLNPAK